MSSYFGAIQKVAKCTVIAVEILLPGRTVGQSWRSHKHYVAANSLFV